jgi:hypothetical protein
MNAKANRDELQAARPEHEWRERALHGVLPQLVRPQFEDDMSRTGQRSRNSADLGPGAPCLRRKACQLGMR